MLGCSFTSFAKTEESREGWSNPRKDDAWGATPSLDVKFSEKFRKPLGTSDDFRAGGAEISAPFIDLRTSRMARDWSFLDAISEASGIGESSSIVSMSAIQSTANLKRSGA